MTQQDVQKEAEIQHKVNEELQKELESKVYGFQVTEFSFLPALLKGVLQKHTPDTLRCSYETYKVLYLAKKPFTELTFYEISVMFNAIASATPETFKGTGADYIVYQDWVRESAQKWNTTVQAKRAQIELKHRNISKLVLA